MSTNGAATHYTNCTNASFCFLFENESGAGYDYYADAQGVAIAVETIDNPRPNRELISEFLDASNLLLLPVFKPDRLSPDLPG